MLTSRRKRPKTLWHTEHRVPFGICLWVDVLMIRHSRFNNNWITRTNTMLVLLLSLGVVATSVPLINQKTFGHVSNHRVRLSCAEPHELCCFPKPFYNVPLYILSHAILPKHPTYSNLQSVKNGPLPAHTEVTTFEHNCTTAPCTVTQIHVPSIYPGQGDVCSNCNLIIKRANTQCARARVHTHTHTRTRLK